MIRSRYYPVFVDLNRRPCLVVGGGEVAARKVTQLIKYGARVTLISPTLNRHLRGYVRAAKVRYVARGVRPRDLRGFWLIFSATDDPRVNRMVSQTAQHLGILANVVDMPSLCSFIAPSIFERGKLTVAFSTGGASPLMAREIRQEVEKHISASHLRMLDLLKVLRPEVKRRLHQPKKRKRYFETLLRGRVFQLAKAGKMAAAHREALRLLRVASSQNSYLNSPVIHHPSSITDH